MITTSNGLKKYEGTDVPDLLTGYNASMDVLDTAIDGTFSPSPSTDSDFDVSMLASCKVTTQGVVYYVPPANQGGN